MGAPYLYYPTLLYIIYIILLLYYYIHPPYYFSSSSPTSGRATHHSCIAADTIQGSPAAPGCTTTPSFSYASQGTRRLRLLTPKLPPPIKGKEERDEETNELSLIPLFINQTEWFDLENECWQQRLQMQNDSTLLSLRMN
jgi:hypothetical protein